MNEIYTRVSIRKFTDEPVEEEKLLAILRAAMQAPSAGNQQPWEFYIVTDRVMLEALSRVSPYAGCTRGAPVAIVSAYREKLWAPDYAQIDMSIAMENLWLETAAQGLGGVWLGIAPVEERLRRMAMITAQHSQDEKGCMVELAVSDDKGELIHLHLLCASDEQAKKIEKNFRRDAESYYQKIVELLEEKL